MMPHPEISEPTGEQCDRNEKVFESDGEVGHAIWYPQMGGYAGKAIIVFAKGQGGQPDACFDAHVWHDGEFPFAGGTPNIVHHCMASQFIEFGRTVEGIQRKCRIVRPADAECDGGDA